jgi:alginate O-acetyltransferase complex protein AlgI
MIAGPIIRARNFLPQVRREKHFDWGRFRLGFEYVLMGLYKKIAIADRMSWLVDPVYAAPKDYCTAATWIAVLAYSLQIYCDFSGYSDIAIGTGHMLGFKLPENFNMPYLSKNITEFWQRWHISLSTWLRDYLFLSLGGSRQSRGKMSVNLMITMTLCGLWHGANWTFVAFGFSQGAMMLVNHRFRDFCKKRGGLKRFLQSGAGVTLRVAVTYLCVIVLPGILFRAQNFQTVATVFCRLFVPGDGAMVRHPIGTWSLVFAFLALGVCHALAESGLWKKIAARLSPLSWGLGCASLMVLIFLMRTAAQKAFIYFQF